MLTVGIFYTYTIYAQSPFVFGGIVQTSIFCTCSGGFLLTLGPPTTKQLMWYPGTPQFANAQLPRPGVWTLGLYSPGGVCTMYVGKGCAPSGAPVGTIGPITGTSL